MGISWDLWRVTNRGVLFRALCKKMKNAEVPQARPPGPRIIRLVSASASYPTRIYIT